MRKNILLSAEVWSVYIYLHTWWFHMRNNLMTQTHAHRHADVYLIFLNRSLVHKILNETSNQVMIRWRWNENEPKTTANIGHLSDSWLYFMWLRRASTINMWQKQSVCMLLCDLVVFSWCYRNTEWEKKRAEEREKVVETQCMADKCSFRVWRKIKNSMWEGKKNGWMKVQK